MVHFVATVLGSHILTLDLAFYLRDFLKYNYFLKLKLVNLFLE